MRNGDDIFADIIHQDNIVFVFGIGDSCFAFQLSSFPMSMSMAPLQIAVASRFASGRSRARAIPPDFWGKN